MSRQSRYRVVMEADRATWHICLRIRKRQKVISGGG
jgi:hypothetical protein